MYGVHVIYLLVANRLINYTFIEIAFEIKTLNYNVSRQKYFLA